MSITLNSCQQSAVGDFIKFLMNPNQSEIVLSGFAGTGKTTLVSYILDNLDKYQKAAKALGNTMVIPHEIAITATTRKAATVVAESLGLEAKTIHSYLGLTIKNNYKTGENDLVLRPDASPKHNCLIFIDEASYINSKLLTYIRNLTTGCKVVFMGDPCQLLPQNSHSSPVFDGKIPTSKLTTVMRNGGAIAALAAQYRETVLSGIFTYPEIDDKDVIHVDGVTFQDMINDQYSSNTFKPDQSAKILAWTNARVQDYNMHVADVRGITERFPKGEVFITNKPIMNSKQKVLYQTDARVTVAYSEPAIQKEIKGYTVRLTNGYTLFVPEEKRDEKALLKSLARDKSWGDYFEIQNSWGDLRPAYASTVHKSQGSTYETAFIDLYDIGRCNNPYDVSRLLYVAISRASKQVVLYGGLPDKYLGVIHEEATNTELEFA